MQTFNEKETPLFLNWVIIDGDWTWEKRQRERERERGKTERKKDTFSFVKSHAQCDV
jgi:hypothetical protein